MYHLRALFDGREPPEISCDFTACVPSGTIEQLSVAVVGRVACRLLRDAPISPNPPAW
ncbi:hypothetical protein BN9982_150018 [Mycobacterium tuberculosis]|nr:hypothetical protein BN9982_150018 [Mycobacterium tuberculosis]